MATVVKHTLHICCWLIFLLGIPGLCAQSSGYALQNRSVPENEKIAFEKALKIFDPNDKYHSENAVLFGNLRLGMPEPEFLARHPNLSKLRTGGNELYTIYQHPEGIRYEFFAGRLFGISAFLTLRTGADSGLAVAQHRYQEYESRGKSLFGDAYRDSNDRRRDPNAEASVWTVWRDGLKNSLEVRLSCPDRLSRTASQDGLHARIIICDHAVNESVAPAAGVSGTTERPSLSGLIR